MKTPICDFVKKYNSANPTRLHMPGHKGKCFLGCEGFDITEIPGADSLYEANGIISDSESIASEHFGKKTLFSTEGSSHCIRAMLYLFKLYSGDNGVLLATRNAHKSFLSAVALLDIDVEWIYSNENTNYLSCHFCIDSLKKRINELKSNGKEVGIYITSPDYLGNITDIDDISHYCALTKSMLLVDNAHGAYLKFLNNSQHPIDHGATMCCDSAHKTLPVLTGGAYLHFDNDGYFAEFIEKNAKSALSLFGSTSPSYLILQSLDNANAYIANGYKERLEKCISDIENTKENIRKIGFSVKGTEPLKITINAKDFGYCGFEIAKILEQDNIFCEFADNDFIVFMITPEIDKNDLATLTKSLSKIPRRNKNFQTPPNVTKPKRVLSPKNAVFSESEIVDIEFCKGRILAEFNIACPPAVPILICGEEIDENAIRCFKYYGITHLKVVK